MPVIELLQMSNPSVFFFFEHADLRLQANILAITPLLVVRRKPTSMQTCAHQQSVPTKQQCTAHIRLSKKCLQASRSSFACRQLPALQKQRTQGKMPRCRAVRRLDVQAVIPQLQGDATEQTPPDLPSYLFKERIVYLGMSLVPAVTELILAELLYLQYDNPSRPVYMYINSAGVTKGGEKLGYESEAFAIYDTMRYIKPSVRTLCVGTAFGESAMLLATGEKGQRGALPSASIMLRQPMQRFTQMQASDIDIYRNEIRKTNSEIVRILGEHTDHEPEEIQKTISRPKYFDPYQAVDYGIIDRVLEPDEVDLKKIIRP